MSNRFVSGGTIGTNGETLNDSALPGSSVNGNGANLRNTEWEAVQQELENDRKRREAERLKAATGEEKSLFDVLQANKAAKQATFEEQNRIRNQFRALDEDEIDFLDEVRERERKEEEEVKRQTEEGLRAFRERRGAGKTSLDAAKVEDLPESKGEEEEQWGSTRKRKRGKDKEKGMIGTVKRRASGDDTETDKLVGDATNDQPDAGDAGSSPVKDQKGSTVGQSKASGIANGTVGLVDYGSDDSD